MSTKPPSELDKSSELDKGGAVPDGWSHLTDEERAELRAKFAAARARRAEGRGIPMDHVLPRYRQAG